MANKVERGEFYKCDQYTGNITSIYHRLRSVRRFEWNQQKGVIP